MSQIETVDHLIEHIESRLGSLISDSTTISDEEITCIDRDKEKLALLKEWKENHDASIVLSEGDCFDESDKIDDRCIEIEEHFEREYGIKFDSCGDMYEG